MTSRLAWASAAVTVAVAVAGVGLLAVNFASGHREDAAVLVVTPASILFAGVGALIIARLPANRIGWLCLSIGLIYALTRLASEYAVRALVVERGGLPMGVSMAWLSDVLGALVWPLGSILLLWFPDGRAPSRRWAYVAVVVVAIGVSYLLLVAFARAYVETDAGERLGANPLAFGFVPRSLAQAGFNAAFLSLLLGAASLVLRLRLATGIVRQQLKVLVYVCALIISIGLLLLPIYELNPSPRDALLVVEEALWYSITSLVILGVPVAIGVAILKYRLYDIDLVINRTLLFGSLAIFITGVYVAVVVGLGQLFHARSQNNLLLSILATTVVAVAFDPVRRRLHRLANRIVYGYRASPYDVLADFTARVSGVYSGEEVLTRTARILAEGLGAAKAAVFVRHGDDLEPAASWPPSPDSRGAIPLHGGALAERAGMDRIVEVRHQGELLGALGVVKPRGESLSPVEDRLLNDMAAHAGPVLHNVRLNAELQNRLQVLSEQELELRRSRKRIVAAQDAERRRLERNIHDGAQQHLVALAVKIRLARTLCERDPEKARVLIQDLRTEVGVAQQTLRDLARGIYPASLRDKGLASSIQSEASTLGIDLEISVPDLARHGDDVEAAVYFCCLEALQNVAKHAPRAHVRLEIQDSDGELVFRVSDDGPGFDPRSVKAGSGLANMADRLAAIGGEARVESSLGHGTAVRGRVPVANLAEAR